jgi:glycosyltransferase involved in cell wall biosynthesis
LRLAVVISHPVQYYAPIFRELANRVDLHVFFGQRLLPSQQAAAGFGVPFDWDVDLLSGYQSSFLHNAAHNPSPDRYFGCDTPDIGQHLMNGRFDVLLTAGWYQKAHAQAIWSAKRQHMPVIVRGDSQLSTQRNAAKRAIKHITFPRLLRVFDAALYVGERSFKYYRHYHYPLERLFFSPHCVDNAWFREKSTRDARTKLRVEHNIEEATEVVLFAAKLIPRKRPLDIIDAVARLNRAGRNIVLMIAGSGPLSEEMAACAAEMRVRLVPLGFCNQSQMPLAYAAADVLVLPSDQRETWGLVANEALASGLPVVVSDACGCAIDLVRAGSAVRTFPMGDIDALGENIIEVLENPPKKSEIRQISDRFDVKAAVDGIEEAANWCQQKKRRHM